MKITIRYIKLDYSESFFIPKHPCILILANISNVKK